MGFFLIAACLARKEGAVDSVASSLRVAPLILDRHASPCGSGCWIDRVIAVGRDLPDAMWELHQGHPDRVQPLQLEKAVFGLGDVVVADDVRISQ